MKWKQAFFNIPVTDENSWKFMVTLMTFTGIMSFIAEKILLWTYQAHMCAKELVFHLDEKNVKNIRCSRLARDPDQLLVPSSRLGLAIVLFSLTELPELDVVLWSALISNLLLVQVQKILAIWTHKWSSWDLSVQPSVLKSHHFFQLLVHILLLLLYIPWCMYCPSLFKIHWFLLSHV